MGPTYLFVAMVTGIYPDEQFKQWEVHAVAVVVIMNWYDMSGKFHCVGCVCADN